MDTDTLSRSLEQRQHARRVAAVDEYERLLSSGGEPAEDRIEELMLLLGRKPADLVADAELFRELRAAEALERQIPGWLAEERAAIVQGRELEEEYAAAKAAIDDQYAPKLEAAKHNRNVPRGKLSGAAPVVARLPILRGRRNDMIGSINNW